MKPKDLNKDFCYMKPRITETNSLQVNSGDDEPLSDPDEDCPSAEFIQEQPPTLEPESYIMIIEKQITSHYV